MESSPYPIVFSFAKTTHGYARVDAVGLTERENSRKRVNREEGGQRGNRRKGVELSGVIS